MRHRPRVLSTWQCRWMLNLFPPLLFNRIRVTRIEPDFLGCRVRVARSWLTRNLQGATFGGTIFSAADPFHAVLLWQVLAHRGRRVQAWLRSARIEYRKPAASALTLDFVIHPDEVARVEEALDREGRFVRTFRTEAVDRQGTVCAVVETEVYLRMPRADQREVSAF